MPKKHYFDHLNRPEYLETLNQPKKKQYQRITRWDINKSIVDTKVMILPNFTHEPVYCKTFGCGKVLSLVETRYGDKCISCQGKQNPNLHIKTKMYRELSLKIEKAKILLFYS